ncbi:MAG: SDR family oxidoreductase [Rhodospirillales bacterium]
MFDFSGRRIMVTGGSRGLGRAIAAAFLRSGAAVSICARNSSTLANAHEELGQLGKLHAAVCDLSDAAAIAPYVEAAADALGGIDVLVNNATAYGRADDETGWHVAFNVDLMSIVRVNRAALPWLQLSQPQGVIVNIGSIAGTRPSVKAPAYGAIKAAIMHYTASQAGLLIKLGVRVNAIAPGAVTAPGHYWERRRENNDPAYLEVCEKIPAGRPAEPDEIADAVLFMASPAARWVVGQTLIVDGGQTLFGG